MNRWFPSYNAAVALPTLSLDTHDVLDIRSAIANQVIPGLVLVWSRDEPERVGEIALMPSAESGTRAVLGRGDGTPSLATPRLMWMRQQPGRPSLTGPLRSPQISREQLTLEIRGPRSLELTNIGQAALVHGGQVVQSAVLAPGELVELHNRALFMCIQRPRELVVAAPPLPLHPFGEADAHGLVGESPAAWDLRSIIAFAAGRAPHVLIRGPGGTGKELLARAIHGQSARGSRPMVSRDAAALSEIPELPDLIDEAEGSTLFLDDLAELPRSLHADLARVLDGGEYARSGESRPQPADLRLIAATSRPEGALADEVLARLRLRIELPGLDERREDIPLLARHLLRRLARADGELARRYFPEANPEAIPRMGRALVQHLVSRSYTTHVRELEALLGHAMAQTSSHGSPPGDNEFLDIDLGFGLGLDRDRGPGDQRAGGGAAPAGQ